MRHVLRDVARVRGGDEGGDLVGDRGNLGPGKGGGGHGSAFGRDGCHALEEVVCPRFSLRFFAREAARRAPRRIALSRAPVVATPRPTMSKAVPCAGVVKTVASPPVTVTPRLKPLSFVAICPWSWYMLSTPSNSLPKPLMKTVSAGKGPLQAIPRAAAAATAGAMISISSRPKRPFSPPCGLSAATAIRGRSNPAPRIVA